MDKIEKIRQEIEKERKILEATRQSCGLTEYGCGRLDAFRLIDSFVDSLQKEQQEVDLEKEIEKAGKDVLRQAHYHNKIFDIPQTMFDDVQLMDIFKSGVYKGYELGKNSK